MIIKWNPDLSERFKKVVTNTILTCGFLTRANILFVNQSKAHGRGSYGFYFKLNSRLGLKVLSEGRIDNEYAKLLKCWKKRRFFPTPYGLINIHLTNGYRTSITTGLLMRHINGVHPKWTDPDWECIYKRIERMTLRLQNSGIYLPDRHNLNIIKDKNNKLWFIDVASACDLP